MTSRQKLIQYLGEAHATEQALVRTLQAHIAMTPAGEYRKGLEAHLAETRRHAERTAERLSELGEDRGLLAVGVGLAQGLVGQALALTKGPIDMVRGTGGAEKLLKNAKDECATEALEIATYDALERLARRVGDERTAELASSIRADEERMLERLRAQIPALTDDVVRADLEGQKVYDIEETGAAQAARSGASEARRGARSAAGGAKRAARRGASKAEEGGRRAARSARQAPGVARAEGEAKGALAGEGDLPIADYDSLTADEITTRLKGLSQVDLGKIDAYERRGDGRSTVLERIDSLRGDEPWAGYDEQNVEQIRKALTAATDDKVAEAIAYERRHKDRRGVIAAAESRNGAAVG